MTQHLIIKKYIKEIKDRDLKKQNQPHLLIFVGLPTSGKTTIAKKLEKNLPGIRVASDDIKTMMYKNSKYDVPMIFSVQHQIIHELSKRKVHIISDANSAKEMHRSALVEFAMSAGYIPVIVYCKIPMSVIYQRMSLRRNGRRFSNKQQLKNYADELEEPASCITIPTHKITEIEALNLILKKI